MGAHSIKTNTAGKRVATVGLFAAGAAVAGAGAAAAQPVSVDVPAELRVAGVPDQVTVDVPEGIQIPAELLPQNAAPVPFASPVQETAGARALAAASTKVGTPYVWGATGPDAFDCSGLTSWAYGQAGVSIPRTSQAQMGGGQQVSKADLQPGDIISYYGASHVALYAGNGQVLHAPTEGQSVSYAPLDSMPLDGAVRY